jgi:large subunit ribosomal protein L18
MAGSDKEQTRLKRHRRIRVNLHGSTERPRLVVRRSLRNLSAQLVDDAKKATLLSLSTVDPQVKTKFPAAGNIKAAEFFGEFFALRAKEKGFTKIVFDRAGYLYHGRIKVFAEALRKGGLVF